MAAPAPPHEELVAIAVVYGAPFRSKMHVIESLQSVHRSFPIGLSILILPLPDP